MTISCKYLTAFLKYNGINPIKEIWNDDVPGEEYMEYLFEDTQELRLALKIYKNKDLQVNLNLYINILCALVDAEESIKATSNI